ncbi:hypothetical protein [Haloarchaeobius baliensis]|uniref:hypothetical protein n=1 Tax=Haloarchaeobius baliensis TaxID=1670458 RepID=UPI003F883289
MANTTHRPDVDSLAEDAYPYGLQQPVFCEKRDECTREEDSSSPVGDEFERSPINSVRHDENKPHVENDEPVIHHEKPRRPDRAENWPPTPEGTVRLTSRSSAPAGRWPTGPSRCRVWSRSGGDRRW